MSLSIYGPLHVTNLASCSLKVLLVIIPFLTNKPFLYKPSPVWCYINKSHIPLRLGTSYFWAWFSGAVMILVYTVLWAKLRKLVRVNVMNRHLEICVPDLDLEEFGVVRRATSGGSGSTAEESIWLRREAAKMLWYPFCYIVSLAHI